MNCYQFKGDDFAKLLGVIAVIAASASWSVPAQAKHPETVTQRQCALKSTINKSEKSGELTKKEADSLRTSEAKVLTKESDMQAKNGGKLSYKDINKVEGDLNKISNKIHKQQLEKRVDK